MRDEQNVWWNEVRLLMWANEEDLKCTLKLKEEITDIMYKIKICDQWCADEWLSGMDCDWRVSGRVTFHNVGGANMQP